MGSLASWGRVYALAMASAGMAGRLRTRLFKTLMSQEKGFFDINKAGELSPILAQVSTGIVFDKGSLDMKLAGAERRFIFGPLDEVNMIL